jgi:hypothetical protein
MQITPSSQVSDFIDILGVAIDAALRIGQEIPC